MMQANNDTMVQHEVFNTMMENDTVRIIDIREADERKENPLEHSRHIPMMTLVMFYEELLDKDTTYYIYCDNGQRRAQVNKILQINGYTVIEIEGNLQPVSC